MIGGAPFSVSMAKPAAALYRLMNASRSAAGMTVVDVVEHAAAAFVQQIEQAERARAAIAEHHRRYLVAQEGVVGLECPSRHAVLEHGGTQHTGIHHGLTRAVRASRIHHVGRIAEKRDVAGHPGGHGITIDHRILEDGIGAAQHGRNVQPVVVPAFEMMDERLELHTPVPVAGRPSAGVVDGNLGNPVDRGESGNGSGFEIG